jgi:fructose-bisphosphate aldolase class II
MLSLANQNQYAFLEGVRDYMYAKRDYISSQVGNLEGPTKPNKRHFDPRVWLREGENTMSARARQALEDFKDSGQL